MSELLKLDNIHTYYDLSHVLFGVSLTVNTGEVVFLLGRNGVGKTTTLRSIMAIPAPGSGKIIYDGKELSGLPTHKIARLGIALVPEDRRILAGLSVQENLEIATMSKRGGGSKEWTIEKIYQVFPRLEERKRQEAITLSGGEQQMLAVARGLMSNPRLLLVDEPVEGLAPLVARAVGDTLVELGKKGVTMLCVDDDTKLACRAANRVYFMDQGRVMWEGSIRDVLENDQEVAKKFLGVG
jgi:branched-chain amino acid transport system ATP-binding protein